MTKKDSDIKFFNGVKERDIHAYIDGHLDPRRKKMVEVYLDRHPEIAEEVRDYVEYNNLLKQAYVPLEEEEVPARLMAVLNRPVRNYWQPVMKVAAVVALCALSVGLGRVSAYQGEGGGPSDDMVNHFLQQIASNNTEGLYNKASMGQLELDANVETDPLNWLTQKIALEMQAPDLSSAGYMMTGRRLVTRGTQEFVELTYKGQDGGDAKLYLKTRWDKKPPSIEFAQQNGQSFAHWQEGPLVYALTGSLDEQNARQIANLVRSSMSEIPDKNQPTRNVVVDQLPETPTPPVVREGLVGGGDTFLPSVNIPVDPIAGQGGFAVPLRPQNIDADEHMPSAH